MSNILYTKGKEGILNGSISWLTDNIRAVLLDTGAYTVSGTTHQYLSDIPSGARIAISPVLSGRTAAGGIADANDLTFSVVSGATVEALALYSDTGNAATSRLICYIDSASAGLPFTPNGGNVQVQWPSTSNRIFAL